MMLTREHIKQAIDAIGKREPEIAYTLNTMLGKGRIDLATPPDTREGKRLYFIFGDKKAFVNKFQFFTSGTPPLEQALLILYGEMARKRTLLHQKPGTPLGEQALQTEPAGILLMIDYEIDLAADLLKQQLMALDKKKEKAPETHWIKLLGQRLEKLASLKTGSIDPDDFNENPDNPRILAQGIIGGYTQAFFMNFPFSRGTLVQAARLNLEFFHIRFLLKCLVTGTENLLFACVAKQGLQGLILLELKKKLFYQGLEVKYIATRSGASSPDDPPPVKGAGTFIMAGVWTLWKSNFPEVKEIFLESELEAEKFYTAIGFQSRGLYRYTLKIPEGRLLTAVALMAAFSKKSHPAITYHLCRQIPQAVKTLVKNKPNDPGKRALDFLKISLHPASAPLLAGTAVDLLLKSKSPLPARESLLTLAKAFGRMEPGPGGKPPCLPVAVVADSRYENHLAGITHLENYRRMQAVFDFLAHKSLAGRWVKIPPRLAEKNELTWVHTLDYVEKIEKTAGTPYTVFDFDTQTTQDSWETARLAAGGVFSLLDEIMSGRSSRGFAFVRPPGHHAEPEKGMGFCIFNNIALGAVYLKQKYRVSRVMIIDIDAHHGNGTQKMFYDSDEVLFVSLHESGSFPGTGQVEETGRGKGRGFTLNIPLEKGSRARDIGRALYFVAGPVAQAYQPDIILVSFGFDLYINDRLASMKLVPSGYALITALLLEVATHAAQGRIAFVMEGGYSLDGIRECGLAAMKEICQVPGIGQDKIDQVHKSDFSRLSNLKQVIQIHKKQWDVLG